MSKVIKVEQNELQDWLQFTEAKIARVNAYFAERSKAYEQNHFQDNSLLIPTNNSELAISQPVGWVSPEFQRAFRNAFPEKIRHKLIYQIPDGAAGDWKNANFFLCLANPRSTDKTDEKGRAIDKDNETQTKWYDEMPFISGEWRLIKEHASDNPLAAEMIESEKNADEKGYYTTHYFNTIYKRVLGEHQQSESVTADTFAQLPLCKLDLVPYRSASLDDIRPKYSDLVTIDEISYVLDIMLYKVFEYLAGSDKPAPVFALRSANKWFNALNEYLTALLKDPSNHLPAAIQALKHSSKVLELLKRYFWEFSSQSAAVTGKNLHPVAGNESNVDFETLLALATTPVK